MISTRETDLLQTLDPAQQADPDDWPQFSLKNVNVTSQANGGRVSLLDAHQGFPVRVEGTLDDILSEHTGLIKVADYRKRNCLIVDVVTYSFSQYNDGSFGVWAAGRAGWYELKTAARNYKSAFKDMEEATGMFYFLADKYKKARSRQAPKVLESYIHQLLVDYLSSDYCAREDIDEIREGFHQHRKFLMKSMLEGQENLNWAKAPILQYLRGLFPADYKVIEAMVARTGGEGARNNIIDTDAFDLQSQPLGNSRDYHNTKKRVSEKGLSRNITETRSGDRLGEYELALDKRAKRRSLLRPRTETSSKKFTRSKGYLQDTESKSEEEDIDSDVPTAICFEVKNIGSEKRSQSGEPPRDFHRLGRDILPSYYEPRGPGDTWTCPYDGCNHQVWKAKEPKSIELIKTHFNESHLEGAEEIINQECKPWVSVDRLLQRLKGISQQPGMPSGVLQRY